MGSNVSNEVTATLLFFFGTSFNSKKDILKKALGCAYSVVFLLEIGSQWDSLLSKKAIIWGTFFQVSNPSKSKKYPPVNKHSWLENPHLE